jgi:LEA14-like dessication related protein
LTSAQLELQLAVDNPNAFSLNLDRLKYNLSVNGMDWVSGTNTDAMRVNEKNEGLVTIPVKLNFLDLGRSVYQLLDGASMLNYELNGDMDVSTGISVMGAQNIPINKSGSINISR